MKKHIEGVVFSYDLSSEKLKELGSNYNTAYNGYDILKVYLTGEDGVTRKRSKDDIVSPFYKGFKKGLDTGLKQKSSYIYVGNITAEQEQEFIDKLYEDLPFLKCVNDKIMISGINGVNDYTEHKTITEKDKKDFKDTFCNMRYESKSHSAECAMGKSKSNLKVFFFLMANPDLKEEEVNAIIPCNHRQYQDYKDTGRFLNAYLEHFGTEKLTKAQEENLLKPTDKILSKISRDTGVSADVIQSALTMKVDAEKIKEGFKVSKETLSTLDKRSAEEKIYSYFVAHPKSDRNPPLSHGSESRNSKEFNKRITELINEGHSINEIAEDTGISYSLIWRMSKSPDMEMRKDTYNRLARVFGLEEYREEIRIKPKMSYIEEISNAVNESRDKVQKILRDIKENPDKYKDIEVKVIDQSHVKELNDKISGFVDDTYDKLMSDEEESGEREGEEEDLEL